MVVEKEGREGRVGLIEKSEGGLGTAFRCGFSQHRYNSRTPARIKLCNDLRTSDLLKRGYWREMMYESEVVNGGFALEDVGCRLAGSAGK